MSTSTADGDRASLLPPVSGPFGAVLRVHRIRAGLTQQELSRQAGVSVRSVRDIEHGRVGRPRPGSVRRLAAAVGLDPTEAAAGVAAAGPSRRRRGPGPSGATRSELQVGVLGPLLVRRGGRPILVSSPLQRCLLGLLALQPDRVVRHEELADVLWGERPPPSSRSLLRTYVTRLRRRLEPTRGSGAAGLIVAGGGGYRLMVDGTQLDLLRFDSLVARAGQVRRTDPAAALSLLGEALACWRGSVLADVAGLHRHPAAVALSQRRLDAILAHADLALGLGQPEQAVAGLRTLVAEEPLHEGLHARLMVALAGTGQQAAALEVFAELRGRLVTELGVEPGAELRDAQARVLRGDLPGTRPTVRNTTAGAAMPRTPALLPADVHGFTGRARHLEQLDAVLSESEGGGLPARTVLLTAIAGMAGVGKTALAVHWAHRVASRFGDGHLYVNLRGYAADPPLAPLQALTTLLAGLGVAPERIPVELEAAAGLYRSMLAGKRMLVVLDNARTAEQIRPLLPGSPGCVVVITSRDQLTGLVATHGIQRLPLGVLTPPEAVALLGQVLGAERVAAEPEAAAALARVCGHLPLALRIAAANLAGQPQQSIAGYLAGLQTVDGLAELAVDGDPHTAVRAAFGHSFQHLSYDSRRLFRLLGLMPGQEVSVPAAAALAAIPPHQAHRLLARLAAAHLVEPRGPDRYALHDLLRRYAREQAEQHDTRRQRDTALRRLLDWYLHATDHAAGLLYPQKLRLPLAPVEPAAPMRFDDPSTAIVWLDAERANLVAAVQHAAEHGPRRAAWLLADALRGYFWLRRYTTQWLAVAHAGLAAAAAAGDLRAQAASQLSLGGGYQAASRYRQAVQHYTAALALARQTGWIDVQAISLHELGVVHWWSGNLRQAADHQTQALTLARQTGRQDRQANALIDHSVVNRFLGHLEEAVSRLTEALALLRQTGSRHELANALGNLGETCAELGQLDRAQEHLTRSLALYREVGDRYGPAYVQRALAAVHRDAGRHAQAMAAAQAALTLAREIGHRSIEAAARSTLASIQRCLGQDREAVHNYQKALDSARQTRTPLVESGALLGLADADYHTGQATRAIDHAQQALRIAGQTSLRILEGRAHTALAAAHRALGHLDQALNHATQALDLHRQTGHRLGQARTLHVLGLLLDDIDQPQTARACWREALKLLTDIGSPEADTLRALLQT